MYKKQGNKGLFDEEFTIQKLSKIGNPLEKIVKVIDFEIFLGLLETQLLNTKKKNNAGAKSYDVIMLFKIIILQRYYGLGDKQVKYQILDRLSFQTFLGLSSGDKMPDKKAIWSFRERLTKQNLVEALFIKFNAFLEDKNLIFNEGQLVDASTTSTQ